MSKREEALTRIVELARRYDIGSAEIRAVLEPDAAPGFDPSEKMGKIFGYLAAVFVIAGVAAFIGVNWDKLNTLAQVVLTLGIGLALLFYAVINERVGRFPGVTAGLYAFSYVLQPTGILVALDALADGGDERIAFLVTSAAMAIQAGALFRWKPHPVLLLAVVVFSVMGLALICDLIDMNENLAAFAIGAGLTLVGLSFQTPVSRDVGRLCVFVGSAVGYWSAFDLLNSGSAQVILPALSVTGVYASVVVGSRPLLATSVFSLLGYISYFTSKYFADSLGWPLVLIILGLIFAAVGRFAMRLNQRIATQ